ncbi:response regulator [candidate division CSSED10-310 bacterium]|uniref:histidine kinase n=1 Tax=candidate division CSSED10-310 bacterium TaxID=2855610 RepID=A0ABV6Z3H9_UNCC1
MDTKILVIDDSESMRNLISETLSKEGYAVDVASDGISAIRKIKNNPYDLITLDVEMPGLRGIEVLRIIKKIDMRIYVIMVTSIATIQTAINAIRQGAYDYITKPFDTDDMILSIKRALEQRRLFIENQQLMKHLQQMNEELEKKVLDRTRKLEESKRQLQVYATQLEKKHDELGVAYEELKELDRMKSEFITVASHELRTPLVAIQGYNSIMLKEKLGPLTERQQKGLLVSEANIARLSNIVKDILDIARIDEKKLSLKFKAVDIKNIIEQVIHEMTPLVDERNQEIYSLIKEFHPSAYIDENRIIQVLTNLIMNAIRFTPDNGKISLDAKLAGDSGPDKNFIKVSVIDTGIGIPEEYYGKIFDRFFEIQSSEYHSSGTTEFRSSGSGLGLSIVKGIIEEHGGRVEVVSNLSTGGVGSTFSFTVPVYSNG